MNMITLLLTPRTLTPSGILSTSVPSVEGITWAHPPTAWNARRADTFTMISHLPSARQQEKKYISSLEKPVMRAMLAGQPLASTGMLWGAEWPSMPPIDEKEVISLDELLPYTHPLLWTLKACPAMKFWKHFLMDALQAIRHADRERFPDPHAPLTAEALQQHRYYRLGEFIFTTNDLFRNVQRLILGSHQKISHISGICNPWNMALDRASPLPTLLPPEQQIVRVHLIPKPKTPPNQKLQIYPQTGIDWNLAPKRLQRLRKPKPPHTGTHKSKVKKYFDAMYNRVQQTLSEGRALATAGLLWGPDWSGDRRITHQNFISLDAALPQGAPIFHECNRESAVNMWFQFLVGALRAIHTCDQQLFPNPQTPFNRMMLRTACHTRYFRSGALTFTLEDLFLNLHLLVLAGTRKDLNRAIAADLWNQLLDLPRSPTRVSIPPSEMVKETKLTFLDEINLLHAASNLADELEGKATPTSRKVSLAEILGIFEEAAVTPAVGRMYRKSITE